MADPSKSIDSGFGFKERVSQGSIRAWRVVLAACLGIIGKPGYSYVFAGQQQETEDGFTKLALAAAFALIIIGGLLVLLFNSFRLTLVIVSAVPFVLIGVLPGLAFTGNAFGFLAFLGTVALLGVYVNHKIYFVDRALELVRRRLPVAKAIEQAGIDRIRPVVLTALTAVLGLLPLTLKGGPLWSAFGWVNVFGLIASIPLSLMLVPALMAIVYRGSKSNDAVQPTQVVEAGVESKSTT